MKTGFVNSDQKYRFRILLALLFALISFGRDIYLTQGFSIGLYKDTLTYTQAGQSLTGISPGLDNKVTVPYPLLTALTRTDLNPMNLVCLQIVLAALAVGCLVYVLSRRSILLSVLAGIMLSTDLLWGAFNHAILTEGLIMSCLTLSLALMILHYDRRDQLNSWELLLAGLFFAWTFSIRPGYVYILPVVAAYYLWLTRSCRKAGWLTGGLVLLLGLSGVLNLARFGEFRIFGNSSMYLDPITGNDIFSPNNGPYSRKITDLAKTCGIDLFGVQNRSEYRDDLGNCAANHGIDDKALAQWYGKIYKETILSHPLAFTVSVIRRSAKMLSYDLVWYSFYNLNEESLSCPIAASFCRLAPARTSGVNDPVVSIYLTLAIGSSQFYALPARLLLNTPRNEVLQPALITSLVFWALLVGFTLLMAHGRNRFMIIVCLVFIAYTVLTVSASLGPKYRYAAPLSPLYSILSAQILVCVFYGLKKLAHWPARAAVLLGAAGVFGLSRALYFHTAGSTFWLSVAALLTAAWLASLEVRRKLQKGLL